MPSKKTLALVGAILAVASGFLTTAGSAFAASKEKVLYSFTGGADGRTPGAGLIFDATGNLYGTTLYGGANSAGTVFELAPNRNGTWAEKVLYSFTGGTDGGAPGASLIFDGAGNLYGTTIGGGANNVGTVFELTPGSNGKWTETVLYSFQENGKDGNYPEASLIFDAAGNLYGTTTEGGAAKSRCPSYGCGTVFQLTPGSNGWTEKVLFSFNYWDGENPRASLVLGASGKLYGTTFSGNHAGNVFRMKPRANGEWTQQILHTFYSGEGGDGANPEAPVIFDAAGNLYGTTFDSDGGPGGTVFELKHGTWGEEVLYNFYGLIGGGNLCAGLIFDKKGNLYSTAQIGGNLSACDGDGCGTVFRLTPGTGTEKVLYSFTGGADGANPEAGLIFDEKENLYGTTVIGGGSGCGGEGCGVVFEVTP